MSNSILTNTSANAALQTLRSINESMDSTQNAISSGLRVGSASDNAAYWSIATTMKSDNQALSAVSDSLGLGSSTVDVAYTAMNSTISTLNDIKSSLVTAQQPGVDKSKIQTQLSQLEQQLQSTASAATFSGSNWLSTDIDLTDTTDTTQKVVGSFTRDSTGAISIGTIDVDTSGTVLFNSGTGKGLLQAGDALDSATLDNLGVGATAPTETDGTAAGDSATEAFTTDFTDPIVLDSKDAIQFDLSVNGGAVKTVTIDRATVDAALGNGDGTITTAGDFGKVMEAAVKNAGFTSDDVTVDATDGTISSTATSDGTTTVTMDLSNIKSTDNGNFVDMSSMDITNASSNDLNNYIKGVDAMIANVTTAASNLGATKTRITDQSDFLSSLMDSIDAGVGTLVDADMNEESTKLKALQTQQQLGIQALSIANSNSQNILSLFR